MTVGIEWLVDAHGCRADALRDLAVVRALLETILKRFELHVVAGDGDGGGAGAAGGGAWHKFPGEGGVTGLYLLTESHLSIHTYPEHGVATLNLYCCRWIDSVPDFPWSGEIARALGAGREGDVRVDVRVVKRGAREGEGGAA